MAVTVREYLDYFRQESYDRLLDEAALKRLENVEAEYGETKAGETILEVDLNCEEKSCDYSIRVALEHSQVKEYWYELDSQACGRRPVVPCFFIDASSVRAGQDNTVFYNTVLPKLAGRERAVRLRKMLEHCVARLEGKGSGLFQLGVMNGRGENDSIRVFTDDLTREKLTRYLAKLNWKGDTEALESCLARWEPYSEGGSFILDFDVYEDSISEKIGINFGLRNKKYETVKKWLSCLEEQELCLPGKKEEVLRFIQAYPSHTPFIQNDISHFKLPFSGGRVLTAKAYLRQGCTCVNADFRAYAAPVLMNLELTTKCPLRCPQCYCDLTGGKDLPLSEALYWIEEADHCGIRTVNLSGGETMCYPYLNDIIRACKRRGIEANVAVSGYGINEQVLKELIDSGVADICVSLNGSTREINEKSREGYEMAIHALELLRKLGYGRTRINWVMHSHNAADFEGMMKLSEEYKVRALVVMVFKPDSSHQLPSVPDRKQLCRVADRIRKYKGVVEIEVEECFSQLRAILGERYLTNLNRGPCRGCGAGRDGISVNVEGRLTPCRHLELAEDYRSIKEYWRQSPVLKQLRCVEDSPQPPCGDCRYLRFCLPCMAVNWKQKGEISMGDSACPVKREERLILVNYMDELIGEAGKLEAHQKGLLHRAFSVFLYHDNQLLIQKRAAGKYHSAGLWANTCCSHPRVGEALAEAAHRRLVEEAGIDCPIEELGSFVYREQFESLAEYELDHIFIGSYNGAFKCNREEAEEMRYVDMDVLAEDMRQHPDKYAAWFLTAFPMVYRHLKKGGL